MSGIGHNSGNAAGVSGDRLKSFVERIERLSEERDAISADVREVFTEAKGQGFDNKILRKLIARRKLDAQERSEQDQLLEVYESALGIFA